MRTVFGQTQFSTLKWQKHLNSTISHLQNFTQTREQNEEKKSQKIDVEVEIRYISDRNILNNMLDGVWFIFNSEMKSLHLKCVLILIKFDNFNSFLAWNGGNRLAQKPFHLIYCLEMRFIWMGMYFLNKLLFSANICRHEMEWFSRKIKSKILPGSATTVNR